MSAIIQCERRETMENGRKDGGMDSNEEMRRANEENDYRTLMLVTVGQTFPA